MLFVEKSEYGTVIRTDTGEEIFLLPGESLKDVLHELEHGF